MDAMLTFASFLPNRAWHHKDANVMAVIRNTPAPELITHLNLSHQNLEDLQLLAGMCSLNKLEVSFNLLTHLNLDNMVSGVL